MAEPDGVMDGPLWPADWQTGWMSGRWVDAVGTPLTGVLTVSLSVARAASLATHTTIIGGVRSIDVVGGVPSGPHIIVNPAGVPCFEFPITTDPDIQPSGLQLVVTFNDVTARRELTETHTLGNPLWLTGDLTSIAQQPGVIRPSIWEVQGAPGNIPAEAAVGDWIAYFPSGQLTTKTS